MSDHGKIKRRGFIYWVLRFAANLLAMAALSASAQLFGFQYSWSLLACAFIYYVVLSFGDALIDEVSA